MPHAALRYMYTSSDYEGSHAIPYANDSTIVTGVEVVKTLLHVQMIRIGMRVRNVRVLGGNRV